MEKKFNRRILIALVIDPLFLKYKTFKILRALSHSCFTKLQRENYLEEN